MTLEGLCLELSLTCRKCRNPVPVNGLTESLPCPHCGQAIEFGVDQWLGFFDAETLAEVLGMDDGEGREMSTLGGVSSAGSFAHMMPRCPGCKTDTPADRLPQYAGAGGYTCGCGAWIPVREAPPIARVIVPGARWVVGEHLGDDDDGTASPLAGGASVRSAAAPVLFACMGCGGSLRVDGRNRTVTCQFCGADNFLPDALWQRLHPVPKVRDFFIVTELSEDDRLRIQAADSDEVVRLAARDDLPQDLVERLARSDDSEARAAIAVNARVPPDVLLRLAEDDDSDVREALAHNPALDEATIRRLAQDSDDDVREAIAARRSLPDGVLAALVADSDWEVRRGAVNNPEADMAALAVLARNEGDSDVLAALGQRADLSVDVLRALGTNPDRDARRAAAAHASTPADVLDALAGEYDSAIKKSLAANPSTQGPTLLRLGRGDDAGLAHLAQQHPGYVAAKKARSRKRLIVLAIVAAVLGCAGALAGIAAAVGLSTGHLRF